MALVHEFTIFQDGKIIDYRNIIEKNRIILEDYLMIYLFDSLTWIPTYWENMSNKKDGISYYGTTIFDELEIKKLITIIRSWKNLFKNTPNVMEISTEISVENGEYSKTKVETTKILEQFDALIVLAEKALNRKVLLVHFGI